MTIILNGTAGITFPDGTTQVDGLSTPVPVADGGTGVATLTANNVILGNGTSALQAVAPGSSGNVLTSNGTTWTSATPAGGGKVLQVVSTTKTSSFSTSSTSPTNLTGMSVSITPTNSSNKVLIMASLNLSISDVTKRIYMKITGGNAASYIGDAGTGVECAVAWTPRGGDTYIMNSVPMLYLDSPATTSAITYQIQFWVEDATGFLNRPASEDANGANQASTITVMEIAA